MKYSLLGNPIPLARPRHGNGRTYNGQAVMQNRCKVELMLQHKQKPMHEGPLHLTIHFYMPMPKSWSITKKELMVGKPHISKPDWSNLLKFVEDCGTGIIYPDDSLISSVTGTKIYDWYPRTEFSLKIWENNDEENNK